MSEQTTTTQTITIELTITQAKIVEAAISLGIADIRAANSPKLDVETLARFRHQVESLETAQDAIWDQLDKADNS